MADEVVISRNADEMQKHAGSFDFILDAVSADHDINPYIPIQKVNEAYERLLKSDVKYRFSIDMASLKSE